MVICLMPATARKDVATSAENVTVEVTVPPDLDTLAETLLRVKPVFPTRLPLKMLVASGPPPAIAPSVVIEPAARKAGELLATEPTLAASLAACNLVRICATCE